MSDIKNDSIDRMAASIDNISDLKDYCSAQFKTIKKLSQRLQQLEKENEDLRKNGQTKSEAILNIGIPEGASDAEAICVLELNKLKNRSLQDELTLEECRKVETYVRTLTTLKNQKEQKRDPNSNKSTQELMQEFEKLSENVSPIR